MCNSSGNSSPGAVQALSSALVNKKGGKPRPIKNAAAPAAQSAAMASRARTAPAYGKTMLGG